MVYIKLFNAYTWTDNLTFILDYDVSFMFSIVSFFPLRKSVIAVDFSCGVIRTAHIIWFPLFYKAYPH